MKAIFIPGNGGGSVKEGWWPYVQIELEKAGIEVVAREFPDPELARAKFWLPFIESLCPDENTVLIGHSSGAVAAMRYAQNHKILGSILVGVNHTDLGLPEEKISGYYDEPWDWEKIRKNQKWIIQFDSTDDPVITIAEARFIHDQLATEYYEFTDHEHFGYPNPLLEFPELVSALKAHV